MSYYLIHSDLMMAERIARLLEGAGRDLGVETQLFPHPRVLGSLPGEEISIVCHRRIAAVVSCSSFALPNQSQAGVTVLCVQ